MARPPTSPARAPDLAAARAALGRRAGRRHADTGQRPPQGLLVADMDSTIVTGETLDELADFAGLKDRDRRHHARVP